MAHYDLLFITTFIDADTIEILLKSLRLNRSLNLHVVLLAQNNLTIDKSLYQNEYTSIDVIVVDSQLSLSKARNEVIKYIEHNRLSADYVMFPDDDSSFDDSFFKNFMSSAKALPMLIDVYSPKSNKCYWKHNFKDGGKIPKSAYNYVTSTSLIIPFGVFEKVGFFDEKLGVGNYYGAGEDLDYFFRCFEYAPHFVYSNLRVYHPATSDIANRLTLAQLTRRYRSYSRGAMYLFCKHSMYGSAVGCIFRGLSGCVHALLQGNINLAIARMNGFASRVATLFRLLFNPSCNQVK